VFFFFLADPIRNLINTEFERMCESLSQGAVSLKYNEFTYFLERMIVLDPAKWATCEELLGQKWLNLEDSPASPSLSPPFSRIDIKFRIFVIINKDLEEERLCLFMRNYD